MQLHNGNLYWPETIKQRTSYPILTEDITCDVLIIGGGISGALCAEELSHTALKTVLVDKRTVGGGSTAANTGLLQYSNDKMLHELEDDLGEDKAVRFYKLCLEAIDELQQLAGSLSLPVDFTRRPSLYYASSEDDVEKIKKEYKALKKHGFEVEYLEKKQIKKYFGFEKPAAIITHGDAEVNPVQLVQALISSAEKKGVEIYENTEVVEDWSEGGYLRFQSQEGMIHAKKVIYSTGYETIPFAQKLGADINRTYAIATSPLDKHPEWSYSALIWETKRPYFYMRRTEDGRIIAGGLDEDEMEAPLNEEIINQSGQRLLERVREHFNDDKLAVSHSWAASFGESIDGLPFIGQHPTKENVYYCLGFGGNGTIFSKIGAKILPDLIRGKENKDAEIFRLDR